MKSGDTSNRQLLHELEKVRQRVAELEAVEQKRSQAEEALRESEERYRRLFEGIADAVMVYGSQGRFLDCNQVTLQRLGYTRDEFLRLGAVDIVHPDFHLAMKDNQDRIRPGEAVVMESAHRRKDGGIVPVEINARKIEYGGEPAILAVVRDLTERKRAEQALRESEQRYRSLFEDSPIVLWEVDCSEIRSWIDGLRASGTGDLRSHFRDHPEAVADCVRMIKVLDVNKAALQAYNAQNKQQFRDRLDALFAHQSYEAFAEGVLAFAEGSTSFAAETVSETFGGACRNIAIRCSVAPGYVETWSKVLISMMDITEHKRAEEESRTLARLGVRLAAAATVESMIDIVREETDHLLRWDAHFFAVRRAGEQTFHVVSFVDTVDGEKKTFHKEKWPPNRLSRPVQPVLEGRPVLINRTPADPRPTLKTFGNEDRISASLMHVPVRSGENVVGILSVQSYTYARYNEGDLQTLQRIADAIAPALERAFAAEALRKSEERYRALVENLQEGIWAIDAEARTTFVTERMAEMLGYTVGEMLGRRLFSFMDERGIEICKGNLEPRRQLIKEQHDFEFLRKDGTRLHATLATAPITDDDGNYIGALAGVIDITERKRAEEEGKRLQEQLAQAQKMEALGTLAGGIAHEYNNIIATVVGYADLTLQAEKLSESARRNLGIVRTSATRGADLTKSLLAFSRKDLGEKKPVNLKDIVEDVLKMTAEEFTSEGIELTVKHAMRVPRVLGNAQMLESVVMNLVINARHAMLKSAVKNMAIQTGVEKGRPFIRVRDTGCGIPKEDIHRIFDPFFTTKGALAAGEVFDGKVHGTGLGLSVCHSIVEGHGGEIKVKSRVGKGATFTVYLPAASRRGAPKPKSEQRRAEGVSRIMVVDDEEAIADLLVDILDRSGYSAEAFTNPQEAVKALGHEKYSMAFIDLQMPGMSGEDFVGRVDGLPPERKPVKVILTGRLDVSGKDFERLGAFATLAKPFTAPQVLEIVKRGLAQRTRLAGKNGDRPVLERLIPASGAEDPAASARTL